jgi:hypothetical protein
MLEIIAAGNIDLDTPAGYFDVEIAPPCRVGQFVCGK